MSASVGILGAYQTRYGPENNEESLEEMIFHTCKATLEKANMDISDIDSIVMASSDQVDGRAISMMVTNASCGGYLKDSLNTSSSGEHALVLACLKILSGLSDACLVAAWSKCSEVPIDRVENLGADPFFTRPIGTSALTATAMQVLTYQTQHSCNEKAAAGVVVKNRRNGSINPYAHLQTPVTIEEVLGGDIVISPLRELFLPPRSDGACALVLVSEKKAQELGIKNLIWINGFGWARDSYWLNEREGNLKSLVKASEQAYKMAGINNPREEISFAELHEITAFHEIMAYEALGFALPGEGQKLILEGVTGPEGDLPVNLSGGTISSNPYFATGLSKVVEVVTQLRGEAGKRQVSRPQIGLAHSSDPFAAQGNSVFILSNKTVD